MYELTVDRFTNVYCLNNYSYILVPLRKERGLISPTNLLVFEISMLDSRTIVFAPGANNTPSGLMVDHLAKCLYILPK